VNLEIRQGRLGGRPQLLLGHDHPHGPPILHQMQPMAARGVEADTTRRLLGHLDLSDQAAPSRFPSDELDACRLTDDTAPAIGPDQELRPKRLPLGKGDVDAGFVLSEARYLEPAMDRHWQLLDPAEQYSLDVVLPQPQRVRILRGEVTDVQHRAAEARNLGGLSLGKEPVGDTTLVEDL